MIAAGVPVIPGSTGADLWMRKPEQRSGREIGYPVIIKAALGGGGKGMRVAQIRRRNLREQFPDGTERSADGVRGRYDVYGTFCAASQTY